LFGSFLGSRRKQKGNRREGSFGEPPADSDLSR
jgi:hypothetical protein